MKKEKKPPCFGDFGDVPPIMCDGCKFMISCKAEYVRREKMRKAEERRSNP